MEKNQGTWSRDVLKGFERRPVGKGTLVRPSAQPTHPSAVILHVHGYNDYFFQTHLASAFTDAGLAFYAVDLARAGRSLLQGEVPHLLTDAREQGDDISAAVDAVVALHPGLALVIHGHSTGGLTSAIWAADRPHPALVGLVLNSPLFGARHSALQRSLSAGLPAIAALRPLAVVSSHPSIYATHQHVSGSGRWEFDRAWKRPEGLPVRAAWANAVRHAQHRVAKGLGIAVPVLAARSDTSGPDSEDNRLLDFQDTVLDVEVIARMTPHLGSRVTELVIAGGVHDLSLSRDEPRAAYFDAVLSWIDSVMT